MLFEPGNIVKMIDTYWHGDLNEPRDEIGKLFVIKEVSGTQYGIMNMENGNSSYSPVKILIIPNFVYNPIANSPIYCMHPSVQIPLMDWSDSGLVHSLRS